MGKITVETCHIEGLKVITPTVFGDARGYFMETYNYNDFNTLASIRQLLKAPRRLSQPALFHELEDHIRMNSELLGDLKCIAVGIFLQILYNII